MFVHTSAISHFSAKEGREGSTATFLHVNKSTQGPGLFVSSGRSPKRVSSRTEQGAMTNRNSQSCQTTTMPAASQVLPHPTAPRGYDSSYHAVIPDRTLGTSPASGC